MKQPRQLAPPHPALQSLAEATSPTEAEVLHVLARRPTRVDAELRARLDAMANATEATWAEELHARPQTTPLAGRDPRARMWANATDPSTTEVGRVITTPLPTTIALFTEPTEAELHRLLTRRAELAQASKKPLFPALIGAGALAAAAATALVAVGLWSTTDARYGTPDLAPGVTAWVAPADVVDLGPSIDLTARTVAGVTAPRIHIAQANRDGTIVDVLRGGTRFEVDPKGTHRLLTVRAGDVEVRVKGTVFTVDRVDDTVDVAVERGLVEVTTPSGRFELAAGEHWTSTRVASMSAPAPEPTVASGPIDAVIEPAKLAAVEPAPAPAAPVAERRRTAVATPVVRAPQAPPAVDEPPTPPDAIDEPPAASDAHAEAIDGDPDGVSAPDSDAVAALALDDLTAGQADDPQVEPEIRADAGTPEPVVVTTAAVDLVAIDKLRQRHFAGEDPTSLLRDVEHVLTVADDRLRPMVLRLRADVLARSGDLRAHELALGNLLVHSPPARRPALYVERAKVRERRGDLRSALGDYRQAEHAPGSIGIQALVGIATAAHALNRPGEARDALLEALQRAPDQETEEQLTAILERLNAR